jgi:uncharacterized cupredoxin-like copper-binding protein
MPRQRQRIAIVAAGCAGVLALAGAAVAAINGHAGAHVTKVTVTEREYHIALSTKKFSAGTTTFSVHNAGHIAHQLDLSGAGIKGTAHVPTIAPGKTRTITVKLTGGTLSLWCPLPGHAALGMKASVKLAGAAATNPGATTSTTPTDTSGDAWG